MRYFIIWAFMVCISRSLLAGPATQRSEAPPAVNERAADFTLETPRGEVVQLSKLREQGPVVVILLRGWVGYQCPLCTKQVADFLGNARKFSQSNVVMIYPGQADQVKEHAKDFESGRTLPANFHFVIDPDLNFVNAWHLRWKVKGETAYPSTFVIDKEGIIRFAKISHSHGDRAPAGDVLKVLEQVKK